MKGAIAGDLIGSPYEKGGMKDYDFDLFVNKSHVTDDTIMTCAIAIAVYNTFQAGDPRDFEFLSIETAKQMREFGNKHLNLSYGGLFRSWLLGSFDNGYNSWGNGSAMRVSPVAWVYDELDDVLDAAKATALPTHGSPEGIRGAQALAAAIFLTRMGENRYAIQKYIEEKFYYDYRTALELQRDTYEFDVSCAGSVPIALRAYHEAISFEDAIRRAISMGGDSDTLGAMTGAIAEARWDIPKNIWKECKIRLPEDVCNVLDIWDEFLSCLG